MHGACRRVDATRVEWIIWDGQLPQLPAKHPFVRVAADVTRLRREKRVGVAWMMAGLAFLRLTQSIGHKLAEVDRAYLPGAAVRKQPKCVQGIRKLQLAGLVVSV